MTHIFIVNPYAGNKLFVEELRNELSKIDGLRYFIFISRYKGYEREIVGRVRKIFEDEELRFYACGGSGTLRNVINGIDDIGEIGNTEVAFYPCGLTNDFLKVYGEDAKLFEDVKELVKGKVTEVDYIRTNRGIALNSFSTGVDACFQKKMVEYRGLKIFGQTVPYNLSVLSAAFTSRAQDYIIEIDGEVIEDKILELVFINGIVFGGDMHFSDENDVTNGSCSYVMIPKINLFKVISIFSALSSGDLEAVRKQTMYGTARHIRIRRKDGKDFTVNQDGELEYGNQWDIRIINKGLKFVVPRGINL